MTSQVKLFVIEQYFAGCCYNFMLVLTFESMDEILSVTIQVKLLSGTFL